MSLLQQLHDAEISGQIDWLFDTAWHVEIGKPVLASATVSSEQEALAWLEEKAKELFGWGPGADDEVAAFLLRLKSKPVKTEADLLLIQAIEEGMGKQ